MLNNQRKAISILALIVIIGLGGLLIFINSNGSDHSNRARSAHQQFSQRDNTGSLESLKEYLKTEGWPCDREDSFGTAVGNIVIDHINTNILYVTARPKGVFKSVDGGRTWRTSSKGIFAYPSQQDKSRLCYDWLGKLYMDPTNSKRILLVPTDVNNGTIEDPYTETAGLWETLDGGESWHQLIKPWMNAGGYGALAIDPNNPATIYFGSGYGVASYSEADPNRFFNELGIIYKTTDGGESWIELSTGTAPGRHGDSSITAEPTKMFISGTSLIVFPAIIEVDGKGAEVSAKKQFGLLKSADAGATWTPSTGNLPKGYNMPLRGDVSKYKFDHIFFRSWNTEFHGGNQRSYVSFDGGRTYERTSIDIDEGRYDPYDTEGLHMLGSSPFNNGIPLVESFDGGITWQDLGGAPDEVIDNQVSIYDITWDPKDKNVIYITGGPPYVWRSEDGGKTWQNLLRPEYLQ